MSKSREGRGCSLLVQNTDFSHFGQIGYVFCRPVSKIDIIFGRNYFMNVIISREVQFITSGI